MSDNEYLTKEEVKQWRSSVEKITLEDFAARLGKQIKSEKETHDLVDIIAKNSGGKVFGAFDEERDFRYYQRPEKIDISMKSDKPVTAKELKKKVHIEEKFDDELDIDLDLDINLDIDEEEIKIEKTSKKEVKKTVKEKIVKEVEIEPVSVEKTVKEKPAKATKSEKAVKEKPVKAEAQPKEEKTKKVKEEKAKPAATSRKVFEDLKITFKKELTDREERVLDYFKEKRGEIIFAKEIADLLELKRDYIYKYIKNLRAKINEDIISNAENGGFLLK